MRTELITDIGRLDTFHEVWRDLAVERGNAFISPEWFAAWAADPSVAAPVVAVVRRDDDSLLGLMPLVADTSARRAPIRFAGAPFGDRFHPAAAIADEGMVARAALDSIRSSGMGGLIMLENADTSGSDWVGEISDVAGVTAITHLPAELPFVSLSGFDWDGYLGSRSSNFRQKIRRTERSLIRDHQMEVRVTSSRDEVLRDIESYFVLHDLRRDEMGGTALDGAGVRASVAAFAERAFDRGWLRLRFLELEGRAVAAFLGWRIGERYAFYQSGYDPSWGRKSVGILSLALALRDAIDEDADEFDLLLGDEAYKRRFTDESRTVTTTVLVESRSRAVIRVRAEAAARKARRWVRQRRTGT